MNIYEKITGFLKGDGQLTIAAAINSIFASISSTELGQLFFILLAVISCITQSYLMLNKWLVSKALKKADKAIERKMKELELEKLRWEFEQED